MTKTSPEMLTPGDALLRVAQKGMTHGTAVTADEDRLLRSAFGRYAGAAADRVRAADIVAHYQQLGAGRWFLCDCLGAVERPPALVPVAQTHLRRHEHAQWPGHDEACDFYRDPVEQREVLASYGTPNAAKPMQLARKLGGVAATAMESRIDVIGRHSSRPGLAKLLALLATRAGLQWMGAAWSPTLVVEQVKAVWSASRGLMLDAGAPLPVYLCTSARGLPKLAALIGSTLPSRFPATRPHGVLILRASSVGGGIIQALAGEPLRVRGRLAVFGERSPDEAEAALERRARAPYLVACLVGRALADGPVEVLSAYAHPCAGDEHLMLVDSDMERHTLTQLRSVQRWLGSKRQIRVEIEKPLFDVGPASDAPRPVIIPDFVLRATTTEGVQRTVIVETMGFAHEAYRRRKEATHKLMSASYGGAPVVTHELHRLGELPVTERDKAFWHEVRRRLSGADDQLR